MNGWKITAIVFIILFFLESLFIVSIFYVGTNEISKETECSVNICEGVGTSYYYDSYESICYCFDRDKEIKKEYLN